MWKKFRNWDLVEIGIKEIVQTNDEKKGSANEGYFGGKS